MDQIVTVDTSPRLRSTRCLITNRQGSWQTGYTPANISILRDAGPLNVHCDAPGWDGDLHVRPAASLEVALIGRGSTKIAESSDALPPASIPQANPSLKYDGAFLRYPGTMLVPMRRTGF